MQIHFDSDSKEAVLEALENGLFVDRCEVIENETDVQLETGEAGPAMDEQTEYSGNVEESQSVEAEFLNVRMDRLDKLQNMAGEMMIQLLPLENELAEKGLDELREGNLHQLSRLVADVERTVMEMRMVPVSRIIPQLKRILRDICRVQKKEVELIVQGADNEADKNVI